MSYLPTNPDDFVTAVNMNGEKQPIPRHWLDHPVLGRGFRVAPSQAEVDRVAAGPSEDWTVRQLEEHAVAHGIDTTGARTKAELLDAITTQTPSPNPGEDETPVAGDDEEN